jgi:hypothetical protein
LKFAEEVAKSEGASASEVEALAREIANAEMLLNRSKVKDYYEALGEPIHFFQSCRLYIRG